MSALARTWRVKEVAELYEVTPKTVYKWIFSGWLPCFNLPGQRNDYRIADEHLEELQRRILKNGEPPEREPKVLPNTHPEPLRSMARTAFERGKRASAPRDL